ncbi:hypothetical protein CcrC1_gp070c [Caulobacter phage C1]|nr:hypothetical protein CcrC1_gp070c [Caulobacter phage C1]UTU08297.1 hypothetical protein CcrC2_gp069c [Caulobacter phage C2]UTU08820.1 hypothetical protein CcrJ4_gp069c [Caulobacter phage J4]UTU09372.1 hypothetical protein CcrBL47_gp086c [Caulobacter phage BL47]UTU09932.1 hypothetical protein CcrRB23_gp070c [Caulobacter phage RB23]WGN96957.1 hypothetical protein [Bertelyvirus sp.]
MSHSAKIGAALAMLASAVKSGEAWSPTLQVAMDEAKEALFLMSIVDDVVPAPKGPITMTTLLNAVGDAAIGFQPLDTCVRDLDWSASRGSTIVSFETENTISFDRGLDKFGMVIWLDRELVASTMERLRAERKAAHDAG